MGRRNRVRWEVPGSGAGHPCGCPTRPVIERTKPCSHEKAASVRGLVGLNIFGLPNPVGVVCTDERIIAVMCVTVKGCCALAVVELVTL